MPSGAGLRIGLGAGCASLKATINFATLAWNYRPPAALVPGPEGGLPLIVARNGA